MPLNGANEKEESLSVSWNHTDYNIDKSLFHSAWNNTTLIPLEYYIGTGVIMCICLFVSIFGNSMVLLVICK